MNRTGPHEPLVVKGTDLAAAVQHWATRIDNQSRESTAYNSVPDTMPSILSASQRISQATGIDTTAIARYLKGQIQTVTLSLTDEILRVAGQQHALHDGRLRIYRNPKLAETTYRTRMLEAGANPDDYPPFPNGDTPHAA